MYAVIRTGGKQYRVEQGDTVTLEKLDGDKGESIAFDDVLLVGDEDATHVGAPTLDGASVSGTIVEQGRGKKIVVFKYKRRKGYARKRGHRQHFTRVKIDAISV